MNAFVKYFDNNNKYLLKRELLKKYNEVWNKVKIYLQKFNSNPVYNDKYIKTKIKIDNSKMYANLQYNKIPKDNEYCTCLSVILLDSIFVNLNKEYYLQIF